MFPNIPDQISAIPMLTQTLGDKTNRSTSCKITVAEFCELKLTHEICCLIRNPLHYCTHFLNLKEGEKSDLVFSESVWVVEIGQDTLLYKEDPHY